MQIQIFILLTILKQLVYCIGIKSNKNLTSSNIFQNLIENYYCGKSDCYPHFKIKKDFVICTKHIKVLDRDFWTDAVSTSSILQYVEYQNKKQISQIEFLFNDWDLDRLSDILLWDKKNTTNVYGVGIDDRLWYAIAFMQIQELKGKEFQQAKFANLSKEIYEWVYEKFYDDICGGGIYWDVEKTYKNSITNQLFIDLAVRMANYYPETKKVYMEKALQISKWLVDNLLDQDYLFFDGIDVVENTCQQKNIYKWTYNQGVYINAFIELSKYFSNQQQYFINILEKSISFITVKNSECKLQFQPKDFPDFNILQENQDAEYSETHSVFKGIFLRYLSFAYRYFKSLDKDNLIAKNIEKYIQNNAIYVLPIQKEWSYPFLFERDNPDNEEFTAGTTFSVFDLYAFYDLLINK